MGNVKDRHKTKFVNFMVILASNAFINAEIRRELTLGFGSKIEIQYGIFGK